MYSKMLRVGTDCSGIEAPIQALDQLGVPYVHKFSSEINKYCIESVKANYSPEIIFGDKGPYPNGDITIRNINDVPDIDLYVCGFPCQPFSMLGTRKGVMDKRGTVFESCLEVIKTKSPKYFILENVHGLLSINKGETFKNIIDSLKNIGIYNIYWKVLNTCDFGLPQNRKRVFIIGTKHSFVWPKSVPCQELKQFVDDTDNSKDEIAPRVKKSGLMAKIPKKSVFIDFSTQGRTMFPNSDKRCPCLMVKSDIYCVPKGRRANVKELLALQGFPPTFKQVVSNTQMKMQIGNSMSVNILKFIINNLLTYSD
jgi:DNA (cytosine-5)-methyltransferase 1